jgi:hypothetical protein
MAIFNTVYGGQGLPKDWLLAYWKLEEDLTDYSGNWYNWTQNGTMSYWTVGWYKWVYFNRNWYISTTLNYNSLPVTFCVWGYDQDTTNWEALMSNNISNDNKWAFAFRKADVRIVPVNWTVETYTSWYWDKDKWYFYCLTVESWISKLYVNGSLVQTINSGASWGYGSYWTFGRWDNGNRWKWYLRQWAVYNRALSADEIALYYNKTK